MLDTYQEIRKSTYLDLSGLWFEDPIHFELFYRASITNIQQLVIILVELHDILRHLATPIFFNGGTHPAKDPDVSLQFHYFVVQFLPESHFSLVSLDQDLRLRVDVFNSTDQLKVD